MENLEAFQEVIDYWFLKATTLKAKLKRSSELLEKNTSFGRRVDRERDVLQQENDQLKTATETMTPEQLAQKVPAWKIMLERCEVAEKERDELRSGFDSLTRTLRQTVMPAAGPMNRNLEEAKEDVNYLCRWESGMHRTAYIDPRSPGKWYDTASGEFIGLAPIAFAEINLPKSTDCPDAENE